MGQEQKTKENKENREKYNSREVKSTTIPTSWKKKQENKKNRKKQEKVTKKLTLTKEPYIC